MAIWAIIFRWIRNCQLHMNLLHIKFLWLSHDIPIISQRKGGFVVEKPVVLCIKSRVNLEVVAALAACRTESEAAAALLQPLDVPLNEIFANGWGGRIHGNIDAGWWWLEHVYFSIYWECHHPKWRTIFFRGVGQPPTRIYYGSIQYCLVKFNMAFWGW